ncbi:MAG: DciA family protein [Pseudomonadota bacterium]
MTRKPTPQPSPTRRMRGFEAASGLVKDPVRAAGEHRGFAVTRLLTHWRDVVGNDLATITRPVKVGYTRDGMGATLTVLVSSAMAPIVQMQLPAIRDKVNAVYGYAAISRISLTQTAPSGFADGQAEFMAAPKVKKAPDPAIMAQAAETAAPVQDAGLRAALEALAQNILTRRRT